MAIMREVEVSKTSVWRWQERFAEAGVAGLLKGKSKKPGKAPIADDIKRKVIETAVKERPVNATHWSLRMLGAEIGISHTSVQRILGEHGLKPHLTRTFKVSNDPDFSAKVKDIVGLYMNPPDKAIVLSVDEKSQIQALDRTQPGLPIKKGRAGTMTHDYKRHGTTTLFAALDVKTGEVIGECLPRHRAKEFIRFLKKIDRVVAKHLDLHLVVDNYKTHKTEEVQAWLDKHPAQAALHPHLVLLAQPRRAAVRRDHPATHPTRHVRQRGRSRGRDHRLDRRAQRRPQAILLDRQSRQDHHQAPPRQESARDPIRGMQMNESEHRSPSR